MKYVFLYNVLCGNVLDSIDDLTDKHCAVHFMIAAMKSITDTMELNKQILLLFICNIWNTTIFQFENSLMN
jgi:hypothetical protein